MRDSLTNTITISEADVNLLPVVKNFFKKNGFRAQAAKSDIVYIARLHNSMVGALRLCPYSNNTWLLRSMCIKEELRNQGIGSDFLMSLNDTFKAKNVYCFPYKHLEAFYRKAGFEIVDHQHVDTRILDSFHNYINKGKNIILMQYSIE